MEAIKETYGIRHQTEFKCYLEFPEKATKVANGKTSWFQSESQNGDIMIFIKYYDPLTSKIE